MTEPLMVINNSTNTDAIASLSIAGCSGKLTTDSQQIQNSESGCIELPEESCVKEHDVSSEEENSKDLKTNITKLKADLQKVLEINFGLLEMLQSGELMTEDQVEMVKSQQTTGMRIDTLVEEVVKLNTEQLEQFLTVLADTGQKHVAHYIRTGGEHNEDTKDDEWPCYFGKSHAIHAINRDWKSLNKLLDTNCGLIDCLYANGVLSESEKRDIEIDTISDNEKNQRLLHMMRRKSVSQFEQFLECLRKHHQCAVISLLDPIYVRYHPSSKPLSEKLADHLRRNREILIELLDTESGLLDEMRSVDCLTLRQCKRIQIEKCSLNAAKVLLDFMGRFCQSDFHKFIHCLERSNQSHIIDVLVDNGKMIQMVAKSDNTVLRERQEELIIEKHSRLRGLYADVPIVDARDVNLTALCRHKSIAIFLFCKSLTGLLQLYESYENDSLRCIFEDIFNSLLLNNGFQNVVENRFVISRLIWEVSDFNEAMTKLCLLNGMHIFSEVYDWANKSPSDVSTVRTVDNGKALPYEIIVIILKRTIGQLFVAINRTKMKAQACAAVIVCAVCREWHNAFMKRTFMKRHMIDSCRMFCHPYKLTPRLVANKISVDSADSNIMGIAVLRDHIYVVCEQSNVIQDFLINLDNITFSKQEDIKLYSGLHDPWDIVACNYTSRLLIPEKVSKRIYIVKPANEEYKSFISLGYQPFSVSVNSKTGNILVVPYDALAIFLYKPDGTQLKEINLPKDIAVLHAVETHRGTIIISHRDKFIEGQGQTFKRDHGIVEINMSDGKIIRTFDSDKEKLQFNRPRYLALDSDNDHVIVADQLNNRIVLLSAELKLKRILMYSMNGIPTRLALSLRQRTLFVSCFTQKDVIAYRIFSRP